MNYIIYRPIIINDIDGAHSQVIKVLCTKNEYLEWVNNKSMHLGLIPDFFLADYLAKNGIENVPPFMGDGKLENDFIKEPETSLTRVEETLQLFLSPKRTRDILAKYNLSYDDFIDAYSTYLKK